MGREEGGKGEEVRGGDGRVTGPLKT